MTVDELMTMVTTNVLNGLCLLVCLRCFEKLGTS